MLKESYGNMKEVKNIILWDVYAKIDNDIRTIYFRPDEEAIKN